MSPRLPRLTGKEMCRVLERKGFVLKRIKGSHHHYSNAGMEGYVTVPLHGKEVLKPKTLKSILNQAKLDIEDLAI